MSSPLRIWLPSLRAGSGADVFMMRLAEGLARAGHEPLLQWFAHAYEWKPWLLRREQAPADIDVIHTGSWQGFAFKRDGVPLVVTEHQYVRHPQFLPQRGMFQSVYHDFFIRHCVNRSYRAADTLVAVSEHTARAMRNDLLRPVHMIYNWVDTERFVPVKRASRDVGQPFRLLFVGNPSRWKGADVLPELAERLGPEFEVRCLGGLRRSFDRAGQSSTLRIQQPVSASEMPAVYQSVDAVLIPTRYEAFGYVAVEAMSCGLPVVGFDSTGTGEVCIHDETALLSTVDDVDGLVHHCRRLAGDSELRRRLGEAGRRRVLALFSEERAINAYVALYTELIEARARRD